MIVIFVVAYSKEMKMQIEIDKMILLHAAIIEKT